MRSFVLAALLIAFTGAAALPEAEGTILSADISNHLKLTSLLQPTEAEANPSALEQTSRSNERSHPHHVEAASSSHPANTKNN